LDSNLEDIQHLKSRNSNPTQR